MLPSGWRAFSIASIRALAIHWLPTPRPPSLSRSGLPSPALAHVAILGGFAALQDRRETPAGIAGEDAHQVHDVRAEHHQVLAAAATVLLAAAMQLQKVPQAAGSNQFLDALHARAVARLMG